MSLCRDICSCLCRHLHINLARLRKRYKVKLNSFDVKKFLSKITLSSYYLGFSDGCEETCEAIRSLSESKPDFNLSWALKACDMACEKTVHDHVPDPKESEEIMNILNDTYTLLRDLYANLLTEEGNYIPESLRKRVESMFKSFNDTQN